MTEFPASSDTGAPPHVAASSSFVRRTFECCPKHSLIQHLLQHAGPVPNGAKTPPTRFSPSEVACGSDQTRAEAAFEAWLTSDDLPDACQVDAADEPQLSLTGMLGELVTSGRPLPANAAAELGMPPGTTQGHAATELLLAVSDTAGPRRRSYRSAMYYLRDHDDAFVGQ